MDMSAASVVPATSTSGEELNQSSAASSSLGELNELISSSRDSLLGSLSLRDASSPATPSSVSSSASSASSRFMLNPIAVLDEDQTPQKKNRRRHQLSNVEGHSLPLDFVPRALAAPCPAHTRPIAYAALRLTLYTILLSVIVILLVGLLSSSPVPLTHRIGIHISPHFVHLVALDRTMDNPEFQSDVAYVNRAILSSKTFAVTEHTTLYMLENEIRQFISALRVETPLSASIGVVVDGEIANGEIIKAPRPFLMGWNPRLNTLLRKTAFVEVMTIEDACLLEAMWSKSPTYKFVDSSLSIGVLNAGSSLVASLMLNGERVPYAEAVPFTPVTTMDTYQSLVTITNLLRRLKLTKEQFDDAVANHEVLTQRAITRSAETFGLAIASFLNLFRPPVVLLGGELMALPGYMSAALDAARHNTDATIWSETNVVAYRPPELFAAIAAARAGFRGWFRRQEALES
mmetsp:Transcript_42266/g.106618  ORF Transcript_42266/g.106618 Transcript_42266/m.106618 type:complete len:461 (+) Transcript_42266:319-1701(+)